jgi:hypothetical protein
MKHRILILALLCAVVQTSWAQASWDEVCAMTNTTTADWTQLNVGSVSGGTLGAAGTTTYYYADANLTFSNSTAGGSGLTILGTVYLYLPHGVTVTCTGANASGQTGAGAGIELTEGNSLCLLGLGAVNATGGNAANGGNGANGHNASYSSSEGAAWVGGGGTGGNGGGGAGAGIGTRGGTGGAGGSAPESEIYYQTWVENGVAGSAGNAGLTADAMGILYVSNGITVNATGGSKGAAGIAGSAGKSYLYVGYNVYSFPGGGGGGAGGFGGAASDIGTGGPGGGGGGGGAKGSHTWASYGFFQVYANGGDGGQNADGSFAADGGTAGVSKANVENGLCYTNDADWVKKASERTGGDVTTTINGGSGSTAGNASLALWPFSGEGTVDSPYLISSEYDWNTFAHNVSNGTSYSDKYVKLNEDITVSTMAGGSETNGFQGTFDGDSHTLTFNMSGQTEKFIAPFRCVGGTATIKNLKTAGSISISTSNMYAAGLVASIDKSNENSPTVTVESCQSSMDISSNSSSGEMTISGLVGRIENATLTIRGCVFDGSLSGSSATGNAGFVSWIAPGGNVTIEDCLFMPGSISAGTDQCATFTRKDNDAGAVVTVTNCYYTQAYGTSQGTEVHFATATAPHGLSELVTDYGMVKAYQNGLLFGGLYYAAPDTHAGWEAAPYIIDSEDALARLAYKVNSGTDFCGIYFSLICDLDLSGRNWIPIGTTDRPFKGNFNGNNHLIRNMTVNNPSGDFNGLFGWVEGDIYDEMQDLTPGCKYIRNFVVKNANVRGRDYTGGVAGRVHGQLYFENVILDGGTVHGENSTAGFIGSAEGDYQQVGVISDWSDLYVNNCLFINGSVTEKTVPDYVPYGTVHNSFVMFGNLGRHAHFNNCYFANIDAGEDDYTKRAYPISHDVPSNVSFDFNNSPGIMYEGIFYVPTAHFRLSYKSFSQLITSVKVNNVEVGTTTGTYDITMNGSQAQNYSILVEATASESTGSGDSSSDPIVIPNTYVWNVFAAEVNKGNHFGGKFLKLGNDITITNMAGRLWETPFRGTFDGGGHTLTFNKGTASEPFAEEYCAPFQYICDATISNLKVAGDIFTSNQHAAGIAGYAYAYSSNTISNCVSSVAIHSTNAESAVHGGFVGYVWTSRPTFIENCVFNGKLLGPGTSGMGGFIGEITVNGNFNCSQIKNCLFVPAEVNVGGGGCFYWEQYIDTSDILVINCYYTETMGKAQGKQAFPFANAPANLGDLVKDYGMVKAYANGIYYDDTYYVAPATITLADDGDNSTTISDAGDYVADVTLQGRTLYKDGKWNTLCLPFNVTLAGSPLEGAVARPLTEGGISGTTLNLTFGEAVTELVAGTPYIIKWYSGDDIVSPVFSGVTIDATMHPYDSGEAEGDQRVRFTGTYSSMEFGETDNSILLMGGENMLYYPTTGAGLGAQHAYFKIGGDGAKARRITGFSIDFGDGEATGIISAEANSCVPSVASDQRSSASLFTIPSSLSDWYTIHGVKLDGKPTRSGVYIHNGVKVVIK